MSLRSSDSLQRILDIEDPDIQNETKECDCGPKGICSFENGLIMCKCEQGFAEKDGNCAETCTNDSECFYGGKCDDINGSKFCSCKAGLMGDKCQIVLDCVTGKYKECQRSGGVCTYNISLEKAECFCPNNYKYHEEENSCKECDCGPKGSCLFRKGQKKCYCKEGFEDKDGKCTECDCGPGATCNFENGLKKCYCKKGFKNKDGKCTECDCGAKGFCSFESGLKKCNCEQGFVNKDGICEEINFCISMPCQNDGICERNGSSFSCYCKPPYFGAVCEKDPCTENPCRNGGTCVQIGYSFKCQCKPSYYGDSCQYVDECSDNPCFNGGSCERNGHSFKCKCKYGYYGKHCEKEGYESTTEEITDSKTEFENISVSSVDDIITESPHELRNFTFNLNFTTIKPEICAINSDCSNGGICRNSSCECPPNFGGYWCEKNILCEMLQPTCRAMGATCKIIGLNAICDCLPSKEYRPKSGTCEDICDEWKCVNGKCEVDGKSYKCICDTGYTGYRCSDIVEDKSARSYIWFAVMTSLMVLICSLLIGQLCIVYRQPKSKRHNTNEIPMTNINSGIGTSYS
ncbi:unnamed protein product [Larinioides sclopetarius]